MRRLILPAVLLLLACSGLDELSAPKTDAPTPDPITAPAAEEVAAPAEPVEPDEPAEAAADTGAAEVVAEVDEAVSPPSADSDEGSCADRIDGVTRHSSTRYTLSQSFMDRYVRDQQRASKQGSSSWRKNKKKKVVGARVRNLLCAPQVAGLQSNDIIKEVNGQPMTSTVAAMSAYETIKKASRFTVKLRRNDQPLTIVYTVE
ncbi:MAG: C-terminal processing protease CtpA/Prc [Myxococcota bacterium]|jgi:C-terminal processing protease CtpA/Prc